jgi:Cu+-exporting ATPase
LPRVNTVLTDKTGTLTEGKPAIAKIIAVPRLTESDVLRLAASLERASEHPLAAAIVSGAASQNLQLDEVRGFRMIPGKGIVGTIDSQAIAFGNLKLLEGLAVDPGDLRNQAEILRKNGRTIMFLAVDGKAAGLISVADPIKTSAPETLRALREEGIQIVMVTGDSSTTAEIVASKLAITDVKGEVLPQDKVEIVKQYQRAGRVVAMAGDGINDAPALAQADVGIAMGSGTDIAMHSADITLLQGDLRGIIRARVLSRATMMNIRQNLFLAFVYNVLGIPIAAGVLYPFFGVLLSPMIASAAMMFSSVSVIMNALRLRKA